MKPHTKPSTPVFSHLRPMFLCFPPSRTVRNMKSPSTILSVHRGTAIGSFSVIVVPMDAQM